jgi:hypothetical protein
VSSFEGTWNVTDATLPNGEFAYTGTIAIRRVGLNSLLEWDITAGKYVGLGISLGGHLYVSCGEQYAGLGLGLFRRRVDGGVDLRWCCGELPGQLGSGTLSSRLSGDFEGTHLLILLLPDERVYGEWDLTISRTGQVYELTWRKGETIHSRGLGLDTPHGLVVGWSPDVKQLAVLDYTPHPDKPNGLFATWALGGYDGLGTETLTRR